MSGRPMHVVHVPFMLVFKLKSWVLYIVLSVSIFFFWRCCIPASHLDGIFTSNVSYHPLLSQIQTLPFFVPHLLELDIILQQSVPCSATASGDATCYGVVLISLSVTAHDPLPSYHFCYWSHTVVYSCLVYSCNCLLQPLLPCLQIGWEHQESVKTKGSVKLGECSCRDKAKSLFFALFWLILENIQDLSLSEYSQHSDL